MKISAIYITKNEEKNIEQSIKSILGGVDEIIIVDTGSNDDTLKICEKYNCNIYSFKWENNFSSARNFAISKAKYDWILFLDADEYFYKNIGDSFYKLLESCEKEKIYYVKILTYNIDSCRENEIISNNYSLKFFKNNIGLKYIRKIHEEVDVKNFSGAIYKDNYLLHTGYSSDINNKKIKRNVEILKEIENKDIRDYFYLVRENLTLGNIEESKKYLDLFFNHPDCINFIKNFNIGYNIYLYRYEIMKKKNYNIEKIIEKLEESKKYIECSDISYYLGILYFEINIDLSEKNFNDAIFINNYKENNNIECHTSFYHYEPYIYMYLSKIEYMKGNTKKAINDALVSCSLNKKENIFLLNMANICKNMNQKKLYNYIIDIYNPNNFGSYEFLVSNLVNTHLHEIFLRISLEYNKKYNGGNPALFMAMLISKNYKEAINTVIEVYKKTKNEYYQYILLIILLYIDNNDFYSKYLNILNKKFYNLYLYFKNKKELDIKKIDFCYLENIIIRLIFLKNYSLLKHIDLSILDKKIIFKIFNLLYELKEYRLIIELLEKNDLFIDNKIISLYLNSLYITKKIEKLKDKFNYFLYNQKGNKKIIIPFNIESE